MKNSNTNKNYLAVIVVATVLMVTSIIGISTYYPPTKGSLSTIFPKKESSAQTGTLQVSNNLILNQNNERFIFKGVNLEFYRDMNVSNVTYTGWEKRNQIVSKLKSLGINAVRVNYRSDSIKSTANGHTENGNISQLLDMLKLFSDNGIYVMPSDHIFTGNDIANKENLSFPNFKKVIDDSRARGYEHMLIMNPYNEPYNNENWSAWASENKSTLDYLRSTLQFKGLIILDNPLWAGAINVDQAKQLLAYDKTLLGGSTELAFSNHYYPNWGLDGPNQVMTSAKSIPLILGELGQWSSQGSNPNYVISVLDLLVKTGIPNGHNGLFPWIWNWSDANTMTSSDQLTLNSHGDLFVNNYYSKIVSNSNTPVPSAVINPTSTPVTGNQLSNIPSTILNGLREGGVNLVFGWWDPHGYAPTEFDDDLPIIKAKGGGHIRLPVSSDLIEEGTTGKVKESTWQELKTFIEKAKSNGLVTVIDLHHLGVFSLDYYQGKSTDTSWTDFMDKIRYTDWAARHISLSEDIAKHINRDLDKSWVVFQPANEPIFTGNNEPQIWYNHQNKLIPAIRRGCSDCTIFIMSHSWQSIGATVDNMNFSQMQWWDNKMIIDMHYYSPLDLTHCGYTSSTNNCAGKQWPGTYTGWTTFGTEHNGTWDKTFLEREFKRVWDYQQKNPGVVVHFSEIGTHSGLEDITRSAYLRDVTSILSANGVGWSCWEWDKNFGIINHPKTIEACLGTTGMSVSPYPTSQASITPTPTLHVSNSPTPSTTLAPTQTPSAGFYRGINLGGTDIAINGNTWSGEATANISALGTSKSNQWLNLNPSADAQMTKMLQDWQEHWNHEITINNIAPGKYRLYVYGVMDWNDSNAQTITSYVNNQRIGEWKPATSGSWVKMGPWDGLITNGTATITTSATNNKLAGIEIYRLLRADINNDGIVNIFDLGLLSVHYGEQLTTSSDAIVRNCDINQDNVINVFDVSILIQEYK
ncbi:cellulase family glycosylhydrolase [candidate division WWE3 bacterium]|nr:cellulase family glycosylhydrolase [candidate division WWE3 bacterium]